MRQFGETALLEPLQALGNQILALLPNVLLMVIILSAGWAAAWLGGLLVQRLLRVIGFDRICDRLGVTAAMTRGGVKSDLSDLIGRGVYWVVLISAVVAALSVLNLQPIKEFAHSFLAYIPHLLMSALILLIGYLLSNFVSQAVLIAAVNAGFPLARLVAAASRWGVQLVAIAMALEQLGIARNIVALGFGITLGGVVLAAAIAFGLGAKDLAKEFLEGRLSRTQKSGVQDDLRHL
jgi:mechanosensitive ion channel-like protein